MTKQEYIIIASALAARLYSVKHLKELLERETLSQSDYDKENLKYDSFPLIAFVISSLLLYSPELYKSVALKEFKKLLCIGGVSTLVIAASTVLYSKCWESMHDKLHENKECVYKRCYLINIDLTTIATIVALSVTLDASHAIAARF